MFNQFYTVITSLEVLGYNTIVFLNRELKYFRNLILEIL